MSSELNNIGFST